MWRHILSHLATLSELAQIEKLIFLFFKKNNNNFMKNLDHV